jgi:hypothetical protein
MAWSNRSAAKEYLLAIHWDAANNVPWVLIVDAAAAIAYKALA